MRTGSRNLALTASIVGFAIAIFVALFPVTSNALQIQEGEVAIRTIRAPFDISFTSAALTERRQEEAADAVDDRLVFDPTISTEQEQRLDDLLTSVVTVLEEESSPSARTAELERISDLNLSASSLAVLRDMSTSQFATIRSASRAALESIFSPIAACERDQRNTGARIDLHRPVVEPR